MKIWDWIQAHRPLINKVREQMGYIPMLSSKPLGKEEIARIREKMRPKFEEIAKVANEQMAKKSV